MSPLRVGEPAPAAQIRLVLAIVVPGPQVAAGVRAPVRVGEPAPTAQI